MRKYIFVLILFCFFYTILDAKPIIHYGLKAGVNIASVDFDYTSNSIDFPLDNKRGMDIAAVAEIALSNPVKFLGELHYLQRGCRDSKNIMSDTGECLCRYENSYIFDYVSLCALGKYTHNKSKLSTYFIAGLHMDVKINTYTDWQVHFENEPGLTEDFFDDFNKIEYGYTLGGGIEIPVLNMRFLVEARYMPLITTSFRSRNLDITQSSSALLFGILF